MIKKFEYTPVLGWSVSRYETFKICKRQYFYNYYGRYDSQYPEYKIKALKELTSIPLMIGNIVHKIIAAFLKRLCKSEKRIEEDRFWEFVRKKTTNLCKKENFFEVHYNQIDSINIDEIYDNVKQNLQNFLNSERCNWIKNEAVEEKSNWLIEPPGYGEFRLDGMKAYCKVDFLFPLDSKIYIVDWKTGKQDFLRHKKQLLGYVMWSSYHYDKNPEDITPIIAYLKPAYKETLIKFSRADTQEFKRKIKAETEQMYSYCADVIENIPLEKRQFKKTENEKLCNYCNFLELCREDKDEKPGISSQT